MREVFLLDWILIVLPILAGGIVLARPGWIGYPSGFPGSTLLGFVLVSVGMTSPLLLHLDALMLDASDGEDALVGVWNLWWTKRALLQGDNPYFCSWLYYPGGTSLALHPHAVTYSIATLPLQLVFAPDGGTKVYALYNLILLASFAFSGYLTYRLALHESQHRPASLLAGLVFAYSAFRFANTARLDIIATELLVLTTWTSVRWVRRPDPRRLLGLLGAAWLLAHASLQLTVIALLVLGWIILSRIFPTRIRPAPLAAPDSVEGRRAILRATFHEERPPARARWPIWTGIALLALAFVPMISQLLSRVSRGRTGFDPRISDYYSADLLDLILPNPRHPIWGDHFARFTADLHFGDPGFGAHLGVVALALYLLTLRHSTRALAGRRWAWGALVFVVLAMGARLHVNGETLPIPLPHAVLSHLPILGGIRTPVHYFAAAQLFLAIAVAMGWAGRERTRRRRALSQLSSGPLDVRFHGPTRTEILLGALVLVTSLAAPLRYAPVPIPQVYEVVRDRAGHRASTLVHVPGLRARENLLYQTVHGQRLLDDVSAAIPLHDGTEEGLRTQMWETLALGFAQTGFVAGLRLEQREALRRLARQYFQTFDIRWIVVPSDPAHQTVGTAGRIPENLLGEAAYRAYRENLRQLEPVWESESEGFTLFEF